jgi:hypothetical protein
MPGAALVTPHRRLSMKPSAALLCLALAAAPAAALAQPQNLQSSAQLTADDGKDSWSYRDATADVTKFKKFIVEPTVVSTDAAAKWGKATEADKQKYADLFTTALRAEIEKSYGLATEKAPDVGVVRLTLLGVTPTSAVATVAKVTPIGFALNGIKSMAGKPGSFSGSAQIAFELMDSQSGALVAGVVRRRSPNALDIGASTSTEGTVSAIAKDTAGAIRAGLDKANGRTPEK